METINAITENTQEKIISKIQDKNFLCHYVIERNKYSLFGEQEITMDFDIPTMKNDYGQNIIKMTASFSYSFETMEREICGAECKLVFCIINNFILGHCLTDKKQLAHAGNLLSINMELAKAHLKRIINKEFVGRFKASGINIHKIYLFD